jgi:hypothetical protein
MESLTEWFDNPGVDAAAAEEPPAPEAVQAPQAPPTPAQPAAASPVLAERDAELRREIEQHKKNMGSEQGSEG